MHDRGWGTKRFPKITIESFQDLFYKKRLTLKEMSKKLGCHISAIASFRHRHKLPPRGWSKGHPMLGKHHRLDSIAKMRRNRIGQMTGASNHNWRGGSYVDVHGYRWVKSKHGLISNHGYIKEHRLIMQNHLGRTLLNTEIVHHANGDKLDNHIKNLCLHTRSSHTKLHPELGTVFSHKH